MSFKSLKVLENDSMTLVVDSGSTKTEWLLSGADEMLRFYTSGINPTVMKVSEIEDIFDAEFLPAISPYIYIINKVEFYGAGCTPDASKKLKTQLSKIFTTAEIIVDSDIIGAVKSLCNNCEGIVAILGTGSNSCLFDGTKVVKQTPALGYILGDEGSGAVLGREFLNALLKGRLPESVEKAFQAQVCLNKFDVIDKVYHQLQPNKFLASLSTFVHSQLECKEVEDLVVENFRKFFVNNIRPYNRPDLPVNFVGSIAYHYSKQLKEASELEGFKVGVIKKSPLA